MLWLQNLKSESGFCWKLETLISTQQNLKYCLPQMAFNFASPWGTASPCCLKMIKTNYLPLFKFSPPFPSLSLPAAKGIYQSFQSAGMSDRTAWSTSAHMSSHNYSRMRRVSTCKQDSTVELLVLLTHIQSSFFKIMGRPYRNHHLLPRGGTAVTVCCVENIRCYTQIFSLP